MIVAAVMWLPVAVVIEWYLVGYSNANDNGVGFFLGLLYAMTIVGLLADAAIVAPLAGMFQTVRDAKSLIAFGLRALLVSSALAAVWFWPNIEDFEESGQIIFMTSYHYLVYALPTAMVAWNRANGRTALREMARSIPLVASISAAILFLALIWLMNF